MANINSSEYINPLLNPRGAGAPLPTAVKRKPSRGYLVALITAVIVMYLSYIFCVARPAIVNALDSQLLQRMYHKSPSWAKVGTQIDVLSQAPPPSFTVVTGGPSRWSGWPNLSPILGPIVIQLVFHTIMVLFVFALTQSIRGEPGRVPHQWGFYVGEEHRRRRYCKVCQLWKPDRTHHCSACARCVLNMDHHCPWINSCVGFYNRKFFIQTLFYANSLLVFILLHSSLRLLYGFSMYNDFDDAAGWSDMWEVMGWGSYPTRSLGASDVTEWIGTVLLFTFAAIMLAGLIPFGRFHYNLLITNTTTVETMDPTGREAGRYDLGVRRNIEQVFGPCWWLWWVPLHTVSTAPDGDGVRWRRLYQKVDEDIV